MSNFNFDISPVFIESAKEDLQGQGTGEVLNCAALMKQSADTMDDHIADLYAAGFSLMADEAKQRKEQYLRTYEAIVNIWTI